MNLREALAGALASVDLGRRTRAALAGLSPTRVLAIGKAASAMTDAALGACDASVEAALVVLPDGVAPPRADPRVRVMRASHPLPDERSVAAGRAALAFGADLALISGGASSLVFVPLGRLDEARAAIAALLSSGADVRAINTVRRHASVVHGGRLGPIATLLVSDVIGGLPHDVGSGPTTPDPTRIDDARAVLARYAPAFLALPLAETRKPGDTAQAQATCAIVARPLDLAEALAGALRDAGCAARVLEESTADVESLAAEYVRLARTLREGEAIVRSAEPAVRIDLRSQGAGGRATHLAALVARDLPDGVEFLAAASDGVDGTSGTGGAVVGADSFRDDPGALDEAIRTFDTGRLHLARGTALPEAPTGVNLTDIHALLRLRRGG